MNHAAPIHDEWRYREDVLPSHIRTIKHYQLEDPTNIDKGDSSFSRHWPAMTCQFGLPSSQLTSDQSENCSDQRFATQIKRVCTPDPRRLAHGMGKREFQTAFLPFGTQPGLSHAWLVLQSSTQCVSATTATTTTTTTTTTTRRLQEKLQKASEGFRRLQKFPEGFRLQKASGGFRKFAKDQGLGQDLGQSRGNGLARALAMALALAKALASALAKALSKQA
jgi:hypothetical protein